jgi:hypothetical protein
VLGGGWGRLGAAGGKGGGNTGFLRNYLYFLVRAGGELLQAGSLCGCCGGVKTTNISHQEKDGYLFSPTSTSAVAAQWQRSGSAVEAQRMRSGRGG